MGVTTNFKFQPTHKNMQAIIVSAASLALVSAHSGSHVDCGFPGINENACKATGQCAYGAGMSGEPSCYYKFAVIGGKCKTSCEARGGVWDPAGTLAPFHYLVTTRTLLDFLLLMDYLTAVHTAVLTLIVDTLEFLSQIVCRLVNVPGVQVTKTKNQVVTEKWTAINTLPKDNAHQKAVFGIH